MQTKMDERRVEKKSKNETTRHSNALQLKMNGNGSLCIFFVDTILTVINVPKIDVADKNVLPTRKKTTTSPSFRHLF